ncbi:hypothetical protein EYZ11_008296 [Aspergillus tanneri]|nr:hypothetical protein EYZ11_008296 [Aspergillus tanneri]
MTEVVDLEEESDPSIQNDPPSSPEVQFVGSSVRSQPPRDLGFGSSLLHMFHLPDPRIRHVSNRNVVRQELARRARARRMNQRPHDVDTFLLGGPGTAVDFAINLDGDGPLHLDFPLQDFPLQGLTPDRGPPPSSYKPPSPAPEGFTRTAGEDDVVCCPNCDAELGTGDETKQQIWVAKQCGHVRIIQF